MNSPNTSAINSQYALTSNRQMCGPLACAEGVRQTRAAPQRLEPAQSPVALHDKTIGVIDSQTNRARGRFHSASGRIPCAGASEVNTRSR
jgi:hypothetical protein